MRFMRWVVVGMTGAVIGATIYEAAFGSNIAIVITGTALALGGVFVAAVLLEPESDR
jgi:hypothetical protein